MDRSCEERMMGWEGREEKVRGGEVWGGQGERGGERGRGGGVCSEGHLSGQRRCEKTGSQWCSVMFTPHIHTAHTHTHTYVFRHTAHTHTHTHTHTHMCSHTLHTCSDKSFPFCV